MTAPDVTQWRTPSGRATVIHFPNRRGRPLRPSPTAYVVALCTIGGERKRFTEDASRVTCPGCRQALKEGK